MRKRFGVGFRVFDKINVNGPDTHPVFRWLRIRGSEEAEAIPWNFNLFLVGRDGETCTRYSNSRTPSSLRADIEAALGAHRPLAPAEPSKSAPNGTIAESPSSVVLAN